jgi:hypothetical protein
MVTTMGSKVYHYLNVGLLVDNVRTNPESTINKYRDAMAEYIDALEYLHNCTATIMIAKENNHIEEYDYWCEALPRYEQECFDAKQRVSIITARMYKVTHPNV